MAKKKDPNQITLEAWRGVEGPCLIVQDVDGRGGTRVAGPKMWGGTGTLIASFVVDRQTLIDAVSHA